MVKFLLQRPIAVLMAFTACFILGLVTYFTIPVSLLPDIAIPEITVQVTGQNTSARELENTVVKPIRQQLMQVSRLRDIQSETRDGSGIIRLSFDFGTNTNLAFIEVNEKIDAAMSFLPRETERPRVVKASATDIPVFYLNLTLKDQEKPQQFLQGTDTEAFLTLSQFAETVIKRRIEQLPEVAMVDITGLLNSQIEIIPDEKLLQIAGIRMEELENMLIANNIDFGSMIVREGYYQYNIKFSTLLRTVEDVEQIYIRKNDRIYQLRELAKITVAPVKETGFSLSQGKQAVTLAIIKQADENMDKMKVALKEVTDHFSTVYPDIEFHITRNQTELLDYTISNLKQNLSLGLLFIFIIAILFLGDVKSPLVIGISMFVSILISFLFFYLFQMSLNIITLSGLILASGMMIDSSIIVTENIAQYRHSGHSLEEACAKGTTEIITPMLSSTFTTIAVFVPLVFMSGIAGAIFYDQAFAVTVGLIVAYFTGIMLLPVLYKLVYSIPDIGSILHIRFNNPIKEHTLDRMYDQGIDFIFRHKWIGLSTIFIFIPVCVVLFYFIPVSRMPEIDQNERVVLIEWNENIHIQENRARINHLMEHIPSAVTDYTASIGQQQFLLNRDRELSSSEAELYFKTERTDQIPLLETAIRNWLHLNYPMAVFSFSPPENIFEKLFTTGEADLVAEIYSRNTTDAPEAEEVYELENILQAKTGIEPVGAAFDNQLNIMIDRQKLLLYNVSYEEVYRTLKTAFKENEVTTLRSYQQYVPITIGNEPGSVQQVIHQTLIQTISDEEGKSYPVPLRSLVTVLPGEDLKTITAGKNGEYIPFSFFGVKNPEKTLSQIKAAVNEERIVNQSNKWDVAFSGSYFANKKC